MYAKIFAQIFDSSIAENHEVRHVFEDMLKLADKTGVVDMTIEAVSRRTNVPIEKVKFGIEELMKPDLKSRSHEHEGRRLLPLDSRREWGWIITNYEQYRAIQDAEALRENWRDAKARLRAKKSKRVKHKESGALNGESAYIQAENSGASTIQLQSIIDENLPQ